MPTTCLICCQEAQYFLLPPCNHKEMCWKCCLKLIQGSTFTCPYCNGTPQGTSSILFVNEQEMHTYTFQEVLKRSPYKSSKKSYQCYSNIDVANFIQEETSNYCRLCSSVFDNMNMLKRHLNQVHRRQFCDVCLENRKCLLSEQYLFSEVQLTAHFKKGEYDSESNQIVLYHPWCDFCKTRYYDVDAFRVHLRMSSHLKCQICDQNYPKLKYVYYKDYNEIEKHFYKSHFVCEIGACLGNKLQNVFVSEHLLQEHKSRVHNKGGKQNNHKQVLNLLLFQQNKDEEFEWDKIGKDFSKQFMVLERTNILKNQQHRDTLIDIRAFYPELTRANSKMSLEQVQVRLEQFLFKADYKSESVNFTSVPIFHPVQMSSVTRFELQRFLRNIYEPKYSQPLIEIFFTRKFDYRSQHEYFLDIRRKMWAFSPISYYYVFPQLVRFFKDTNRTKIAMDQYYAESLRNLRINRVFVFHKKERYSDILNILQDQIEAYIYELMIQEKINLAAYQKYLKDLNPEYYQKVHWELFYVQKEKIMNLYHMIEKTRTSELLKFNWLLKLGMNPDSHKAIYDKFYYKTIDDCGEWVKAISLQELALVYAYVDIALQSFIDKKVFIVNKANPHALFLGTVISKIKTCISAKELTALRQLEQKSGELAIKLSSIVAHTTKKSGVINEEEHPSLLSFENETTDKGQENLVIFGQNVSVTNNSHIRVNRKNQRVQESSEDFPELFVKKEKKEVVKEEDDFPVFNYQQKSSPQPVVSKKKKFEQDERSNIERLELFNPKNAFTSKKLAEEFYERKQKQKQKTQEPVNQSRGWQDDWPTLADKKQSSSEESHIQKNTKKKKKKDQAKNEEKPAATASQEKVQPPPPVEQVIMKKKTKEELRAEEQMIGKKLKSKVSQQEEKVTQENDKPEEKEKEEKPQEAKKIKQKKRKVRLDATDSEQQQKKQAEQKKAKLEQKHKAFLQQQKLKESLRYHEGFDSLLEPSTTAAAKGKDKKGNTNGGVSIINELIKESKKEDKEPEIVIKKGKKGKTVVIEKVDIWKL